MLVVSFLLLTAGFAGDGVGGGGARFFGVVAGAGAGCFGGGLWEGDVGVGFGAGVGCLSRGGRGGLTRRLADLIGFCSTGRAGRSVGVSCSLKVISNLTWVICSEIFQMVFPSKS